MPTRTAFEGPSVWTGSELQSSSDWSLNLGGDRLGALERCLSAIACADKSAQAQAFSQPALAELGRFIADATENGHGLARLRGLPCESYPDAVLGSFWLRFCQQLGVPVSQNVSGQMLREITDEGAQVGSRYGQVKDGDATFLSSRARTASTARLRFHTDRCDVVALLCVRPALAGGVSKVASIAAIHNEIARRRPDLLEVLYQPYHRSRLGEEAGGEHLAYALPIFAVRDGKLTSHFSRTYIEAAELQDGVPKMTDAQWQALDLLAEVAEELCHETHFAPGDMQLLNNHLVYHARTAYEDGPSAEARRLLYRVWLSTPDQHRALPPDHGVLWGHVERGQVRGGIRPSSPSAAAP